jgi:predicted nucleic acid-binding protein
MIVLDASAVVELLANGELATEIGLELAASSDSVAVPCLLDVEVVSALRSLEARKRIEGHQIQSMLDALASLPAVRYEHTPLMNRAWELRRNFTAYDAVYIALAEKTGSVLYTCDEKLRHGHRAEVRVFTQTG